MPPSDSLVMLNTSHEIVTQVRLPLQEEIEALNTDTLPPRELLDPSSMRGARYRLLEKGFAELKGMLSEPHPRQLRHMDVSPKQDAAMRELLVCLFSKTEKINLCETPDKARQTPPMLYPLQHHTSFSSLTPSSPFRPIIPR